MTNAANLASAAGTGFALRNRLINGNFEVWQRGTSFTGSLTYTADRWLTGASATNSVSRSTDVPTNLARYSLQISNSAATTANRIQQRIEAVNCVDLVGQAVTLSFWAKNVSGTSALQAALQFPTSTADDFSAVTTVSPTRTVPLASTWTFYQFSWDSLPAGVANGLQVLIYRDATDASSMRVALVQLEEGYAATPFERRSFGLELALCQRYYETSFDIGTTPADGISGQAIIAQAWNAANASGTIFFKVPKRAVPSFAFYSGNNIASPTNGMWQWLSGAWNNGTATNPGRQNTNNFQVTVGSANAYTVTGAYSLGGGWVASAEL